MNKIRSIATVGAGKMIRGIAVVCAHAGYEVTITDLKDEILQQAFEVMKSSLDFLVETGFITRQGAKSALARIKSSVNLTEAMKDADFVIESVPEVLELKKQVFRQLDSICRADTILATNTSSFRISDIAEATTRPQSVVGFHWVNPAYIIPALEVIRGKKTSDVTVNTARDLALKLGKTPIVCKEVPGFIINRFQMAILEEAISLLEDGAASIEDIDNAMQLGLGIRFAFWGPFKSSDLFGNKRQALAMLEYMYRETGAERFRPPDLLRQKVERGELGLVTGKGWYDFSAEPPDAVIRERDKRLVKIVKLLKAEGLINT